MNKVLYTIMFCNQTSPEVKSMVMQIIQQSKF